MFKSVLLSVFLLSSATFAHAAEPEKVAGAKWGVRVMDVKPDQVVVKLMMMSGNCVSPPMSCDTPQVSTQNGLSVSGDCTSGPSPYGTAGDMVTLSASPAATLQIGQDAEIWMGDTGATFQLPDCITAEW